MSKLSLEALKERAEATASTELLATISGGVENSCHTDSNPVDVKKLEEDLHAWGAVMRFIDLFR
ncbi:MAG: hypothetical protein O9282_02555 [Flavobacterium sp.]|jgi:hypothetical protein|uniref:hypothetical protein n=1 Tax=Flavobacterium sp. TaxID=239 RepID=UPI0022C3DB31|nr:hypothetical protein [Flavobacterium sp.]MCZ8330175.1 hypothetical protein [Flavobacterium sp.]